MSQQGDSPHGREPSTPERLEGGRAERPIVWGVVALVGVGLIIGLIAAGSATAAFRILGLTGGDSAATVDAASDELSMYLPEPSQSEGGKNNPRSPLISAGPDQRPKANKKSKSQTGITLSAGQSSVSPMSRIDLVGKYNGGEGAVLQVQRKENGTWSDFPVSVTVNGGQFSTYVQTGRTGKNIFRMADTDSKKVSNAVTVTIGG